uniref:HATPase_c domain-containing protein n=1 Tax=Panagrellus redivivus TaxID=6233 RepID=A0A7E4W245_PANRE
MVVRRHVRQGQAQLKAFGSGEEVAGARVPSLPRFAICSSDCACTGLSHSRVGPSLSLSRGTFLVYLYSLSIAGLRIWFDESPTMAGKTKYIVCLGLLLLALSLAPSARVQASDDIDEDTVVEDIAKGKHGSTTDDEVVAREEESIKLDGLSVAEVKQLREKSEKHQFQAEVSRMMKLIINSLYRNKEIFLRELISNASDALDKIRLLSLTDPNVLNDTEETSIRIKADKEAHVLHITDTGIGMTKQDLINNLGTIARSGTSEFLSKLLDTQTDAEQQQDLIGQFGVGFYSAFLVADRVVVTTRSIGDKQYIWESDSASFSIVEDPRGNTLARGTQISLYLKEEAYDFLEPDTLKKLVQKYSQFINFDIFLWQSKTETVEEPAEEEETKTEDGAVEEEKEEKPATKSVEKTVWDWEKINSVKPIWMRKPHEVTDDEYDEFYKSVTKDYEKPFAHVHFTAEGEVSFKSILYVPKKLPQDAFQNYGKVIENIKLYVRRVFITDDFQDMMPKYLSFIRGIVDSDDLPLNVSRENLQQHKLLKVIKKKLVRKVLDMIKKLSPEQYDLFWKEFSTNIKLGVMEDPSNRTRLAKLLRFFSSNDSEKQTTLADYVERMKEKQESIFYVAGTSRAEIEASPFLERLLKKGYEVLYLTEPVDEYTIQAMPEFDGKKFQNIAKEGVKLDENEKEKEQREAVEKNFEPLTNWLKETALNGKIEKAVVSQRLTTSPSALVASSYGWSGNMERIMKSQAYAKAQDPTQEFYANQKKTFEINPRHPVVKELLRRVESNKEDETALYTAQLLFDTATLRSGYVLQDQVGFAERIEQVLRQSMELSLDEQVEEEPVYEEAEEAAAPAEEDEVKVEEEHSEL